MRVFEALSQENLRSFRTDGPLDLFEQFDGTRMLAGNWSPPELTSVDDEFEWPDWTAFLPHVPLLSEAAVGALGPLLEPSAELLPVSTNAPSRYYAANVVANLNAVDYRNSEVKLFKSGKVMRVKKFAFHEDIIASFALFRLRGIPGIYCTDRFVATFRDSGLVGLQAKELWSSDP